MRGFVAEAAIPRFVDKLGNVNEIRNWAGKSDKMENVDGSVITYDDPSGT